MIRQKKNPGEPSAPGPKGKVRREAHRKPVCRGVRRSRGYSRGEVVVMVFLYVIWRGGPGQMIYDKQQLRCGRSMQRLTQEAPGSA
jgi:hypothetical protein